MSHLKRIREKGQESIINNVGSGAGEAALEEGMAIDSFHVKHPCFRAAWWI